MASEVESVQEVNHPVPSLEPKPEKSDMQTRVEAMWEQMNQGVSSKPLKPVSNKRTSSAMSANNPQKQNNNWMSYLGLKPKETRSDVQDGKQNVTSSAAGSSSQKKSDCWMNYLGLTTKKRESSGHDLPDKELSDTQNDTSDEAKKLAAAALSAVKDAAAAASGRGKVEITEVRDFAGQEIEIKKLVDAESKEAAEKAKALAPSAVDAVLEQIKKKQKLSVLDKTKKDWGEFKEEKGLEEELDAYKKSSNQYLDKVSFLQRTDLREFERERDARLAQQARRRPDMREDV